MGKSRPSRLPPGRQPYDSFVGFKVGSFAGLAIGTTVPAVTRVAWFLLVRGVAGAVIGHV